MKKRISTDVVIIGAGPVGLFAVFECGMLGLKCHVVDSLEEIGGQCTALYPEKPIYDIPACPTIQAADLIARLEAQAAPFKPVFHLSQTLEQLHEQDNGFYLQTSTGTQFQTSAVIIAAGAGSFGPNRPPIDNIEQFEGTSVFYAVRNRTSLAGKRIVIAGGGDSALDWALSLVDIAKSVSIVHRREQFRAAPETLSRVKQYAQQGKIDLVAPYQLKGLEGDNAQIKKVIVAAIDGQTRLIEADILLPFFGLTASLGPIAQWGLGLDRNAILITQETSESSKAGIYAVGDIASYPHKLKLILTGFAEAAQAAHSIYRRLYPDKPLHMEYSTTKGLPL